MIKSLQPFSSAKYYQKTKTFKKSSGKVSRSFSWKEKTESDNFDVHHIKISHRIKNKG